MTSWRRKQPRINIDTRLRKEHSGSFSVLNHWLCGQCNRCAWIAENLHGDIRAWKSFSMTRDQCCGLMGKSPLCQNVLGSCCSNFESLHYWLYYARKDKRILRTKSCCRENLKGTPEETNCASEVENQALESRQRKNHWEIMKRYFGCREPMRPSFSVPELFVVLTTLCEKTRYATRVMEIRF